MDKLENRLFTPAVTIGKRTYTVYGEPRVNQAREFGQAQWEKTVKPQIDAAQAQLSKSYDASLAPHVSKVSSATAPYYTAGRDNVLQTYDTQLLPLYTASRPYVEKSYALGHKAFVETGLPYAQWAWGTSMVFIDRTIWPKLRILYGENVEPQLMRIGERLGRYRDGKKLKAAVQELDSSEESISLSSSISSVSSSVESAAKSSITAASSAATTSSVSDANASRTPEEEASEVREKIANDLKNWQEKFAKAAGKGTEELDERVKEITEQQVKTQVGGVGDALLVQLEETVKSEYAKLKKSINKIVHSLPEEPAEEDVLGAEEEVAKAVRTSGQAVKSRAQALRTWKERFDNETQSLIAAASDSTLEVIDNIRDLGLQEVGMRWAWMEGVTYKDWSNYHSVKKTFDQWRNEVEAVAKDHPSLLKALSSAEDIEGRGMALAEDAAKELIRLKEVGMWKVQSADQSDDFSTRIMPAKVALTGQKIVGKARSASESVFGTPRGSVDSIVSQAAQKASDASQYGESVLASASGKISRAVPGSQQPKVESVVSAASKKAEQAVNSASKAVVGTPAPPYKSVASEISKSVVSASSAIASALPSSSTPLSESAYSVISSMSNSASSAASQASKKVSGGAEAQEVEDRVPIFDDLINEDDDYAYSEKLQSIVSQAGDKYSDVTRAVSEALMGSTTTQAAAESITSLASEQYSSALEAASRVLYGTAMGTAEILASVASSRYAQAVSA